MILSPMQKRIAKAVISHAQYFALQDIHPVGVTIKMERRDADVYDKRKVKKASATE